MTKWYYLHDAGIGGPIEDGELRRLAAAGRVRRDSPVTPVGAVRWFRAGDYEATLDLRFADPGGVASGTTADAVPARSDDDRAALVEAAFGPALPERPEDRETSPAADGPTPRRPAPLGRRAVALFVDLVVFGTSTAVLCVAIGGVTVVREAARTDYRVEVRGIVVVGVLALGYFGVLTGRRGRAAGKALTGLRVVDAEDGGPIGAVRGMARFVAAVGLLILCIVPALIDAAWATVDPERQTLHDKLVDSVVVRARP